MKSFKVFTFIILGLSLAACSSSTNDTEKQEKDSDTADMKLNKYDVSYALGYNIGDVMSNADKNLYLEEFFKGVEDAFHKSGSPRMGEEDVRKLLMMYNFEMSKIQQARNDKLKTENVQKGQDFITSYENQPGVKKHPSGILYKVIEEGTGPKPGQNDRVIVEYTGKKVDGEIFFTTKKHGNPANFTVANVIRGWMIALQQMPVGSTWEIVVPPELAYGEQGISGGIGPMETLIFEMHLVRIQDDEKDNSAE